MFYLVYVLGHFSCVQLFVTLWTVACQAPLSMGFSRQEYWSEFPCPPPGDLGLVALQCCVSFCSTAKWISYTYTWGYGLLWGWKNVRIKVLALVSIGLHRGMEPQCASLSVVSFAGSPLVELEIENILRKLLFLILFFFLYRSSCNF